MNNYFLIIVLVLTLVACGDEPVKEPIVKEQTTIIEKKPEPKQIKFIANMDHLRMRDNAGKEGKIIGNLSTGETLIYMGEKSSFNTPVKLRGYGYNDPWLKVKTKSGDEGWVYAGGVKFGDDLDNDLVKPLIDNRLKQLFGTKLAEEIQEYKTSFSKVNNSKDLAKTYRNAMEMRDEVVQILHDDIEIVDPQKAADMDWMQAVLPGFITQFAAEGTLYHLFFYYEDWAKKARRTSGKEDNDFFELMYAVYPIDHIEHFFPAWFLQTWDYGGHSELGKGVHNDLLDKMNRLLAESDLFAPEIDKLKNDLLNDITNNEITYWYDQKAILVELNSILEANYGILSDEDKIALETRKKHFENPLENNIKLDRRSGNEE
jgi:uncharacterized protein YcfL